MKPYGSVKSGALSSWPGMQTWRKIAFFLTSAIDGWSTKRTKDLSRFAIIQIFNEIPTVCSHIVHSQDDSFALSILQITLHVNIKVSVFTLDFDQLNAELVIFHNAQLPLVRPTSCLILFVVVETYI